MTKKSFSVPFFIFCSLILLVLLHSIGCNSTGGLTKPDFSALKPAGPAAKALAIWEPAVKHEAESQPKRGFGGRVYFYDQEARKPIKVKGNVVVYAFDEENRRHDDNVPTRSYFFEANDVKKLYAKSKLGHSYNFWIPWDEEGPDGKAKKISLIVRYVPEVGSSVVSSQAAVYLPGKFGQTELVAKAEWDSVTKQEGTIQQVSYQNRNTQNGNNVSNFLNNINNTNNTNNANDLNDSKNTKPEERIVESNDNRPTTMKTSTIDVTKHKNSNP
ncbi:MAG: hypothetical protein LBQ50_06270 [Planctomycetaceae bacterium]|jgi:hypothetical protein|nr:hypothetical protein [Planctomycetaceae bacterium]